MLYDPFGSMDLDAFRAAVRDARDSMARRQELRYAIIRTHAQCHQYMPPPMTVFGIDYNEVVKQCPLCRAWKESDGK